MRRQRSSPSGSRKKSQLASAQRACAGLRIAQLAAAQRAIVRRQLAERPRDADLRALCRRGDASRQPTRTALRHSFSLALAVTDRAMRRHLLLSARVRRRVSTSVMRRLLLLPMLLIGCGASGSHPSALVERSEEEAAEACWRAHLPVEPCERPVHPEVVGLWGHESGSSFSPEFVYDGCHVTLSFRCPYVGDSLSSTMEELRLSAIFAGEAEQRRARGIPEHEHHGPVHRTHALWRDEVLLSVSEVSIEIEVGRLRTADDGSLTLSSRSHDGRSIVLTRYREGFPLDGAARALLCPPEVVRRPGEWSRVPRRSDVSRPSAR